MSTVYWGTRRPVWLGACAAVALAFLTVVCARATESAGDDPAAFKVGDIRLEGLQRISAGTVYNYLPINIGDAINRQRVRDAIRAVYATNFFRDVQMRRDGNTLVVVVLERPSIESFEITGNKDIKTEDLQKSLRGVGLATGKVFDRAVLEDVTQYLTDQYFSRGKYAVRVETRVEDLPGNRVKLKIDITEGKRARIRQINLVGVTRFRQRQILDTLELKTPNWLSWYKQDDRYSRETLQGDLEKVRNFYMDRGYANFNIESTQVTISPEKDDIFITAAVVEGEIFKLADVRLAGTFVVPRQELERFLLVSPGQIFDRKLITATQELIQNRLGRDGYAFAKVEPVPTADNANHTIQLTFCVDPGNRVYVRNITFSGSSRINDEVLRRELRQLEGGWLSNTSLERSKQRIQRLPFVKKVDFETTPVTGTADLVDVDFKVEDGPSSQLSGGIGYSEVQRFSISGNYTDANVFGSGERVSIGVNTGKYAKSLSLSHTNPYTTPDGISRTLTVAYSDISRFTSSYSEFATKTYLAGIEFGYPVTEYQVVRLGASYQHVDLATSTASSTQIQNWLQSNGNTYFRRVGSDYVPGTTYDTIEASLGWTYDSRNRTLFPTAGALHSLLLTATAPAMDVQYAIANYQYQQLLRIPLPLLSSIPFAVSARIGYGTGLGRTTSLPPNRNFYLGGPDSVRGFREGTIGPRDSLGNPYGGNASVATQVEAILPLPEKFASSARVSLFFDAGNAFYYGSNVSFKDKAGFDTHYHFSPQNLDTSAGLAVQWLAPLGLFRFSLGMPINYQHNTWKHYGEDTEIFQFSIGNAF
jgi:outer membrane protein insertion porin family